MSTPEEDRESSDATDAAKREPGAGEPEERAPLGGDETTANQLEADNPAEEATLDTLDPDSPPA